MTKKLLLVLLVFVYSWIDSPLFAQYESNNWYFGANAGMNFNTFPVSSLTGGMISAQGGSASISDNTGNLLFYTEGYRIYNKNHQAMANGQGLLGHPSATQNSLIIQKPGSTTLYYVFTNGAYTDNNGLCYSEVDITLNGGLGDVTALKNIPLLTNTSEKLTGVRHANQTDYWVMTHGRNSNSYYAYPVSSSGIGSPVVSTLGTSHSGSISASDVSVGQMKFSPDGHRLAVATSANGNTIEIFQFNNLTGILSNPITITGAAYSYPYGIEFSPDGTLLYFSISNTNNKVYQVNLQAGSASAIINSVQLVATSSSTNVGALQLGSDSKIYLGRYLSYYVGVFNNPNALGASSAFVDDGVFLGIYRSRRGLPNFVTSWFNNPRFIYENVCFGDTTYFYVSDLTGVITVLWNFGDNGSGPLNTSTLTSPTHIFSDPGTYNVQLIRYFTGHSDTVTQQVTIYELPEINIGSDEILICPGEDTLLNAGPGYASYSWSNGSVSQSMLASIPGIYAITVTNDLGCENSDQVEIISLTPPSIDLGNDREICEGSSVSLFVMADNATYHWSNGASTQNISITQTNTYSVTVTNACGQDIDSMHLYVYPTLSIELGDDIDICPGDTAFLDGGNIEASYLWSTNETSTSIETQAPGTYYLTISYQDINCPTASDSIQVILLDVPEVSAGLDTLVCEGTTVMLQASGIYVTDYLWSTGATSSSVPVSEPGEYFVIGFNICSADSDTVSIFVQPAPVVTVSNDTSIFDDETVQLIASYNSDYQYAWSPATFLDNPTSNRPIADPETSTVFYLVVTDSLGCTNQYSISIEVNIRPLPDLIIHDVFTPNGDGVNETFYIEHIERYENSFLQVFNRDGLKVYEQTNYQNDWDGKYKDNPLPAHTYFFILIPNEEGKEPIHSTVTIIR